MVRGDLWRPSPQQHPRRALLTTPGPCFADPRAGPEGRAHEPFPGFFQEWPSQKAMAAAGVPGGKRALLDMMQHAFAGM